MTFRLIVFFLIRNSHKCVRLYCIEWKQFKSVFFTTWWLDRLLLRLYSRRPPVRMRNRTYIHTYIDQTLAWKISSPLNEHWALTFYSTVSTNKYYLGRLKLRIRNTCCARYFYVRRSVLPTEMKINTLLMMRLSTNMDIRFARPQRKQVSNIDILTMMIYSTCGTCENVPAV